MVYYYPLVTVLRFLNEFLAKYNQFYPSVPILVGNANEISKFCEQFSGKFDTQKYSKLAKIAILLLIDIFNFE